MQKRQSALTPKSSLAQQIQHLPQNLHRMLLPMRSSFFTARGCKRMPLVNLVAELWQNDKLNRQKKHKSGFPVGAHFQALAKPAEKYVGFARASAVIFFRYTVCASLLWSRVFVPRLLDVEPVR